MTVSPIDYPVDVQTLSELVRNSQSSNIRSFAFGAGISWYKDDCSPILEAVLERMDEGDEVFDDFKRDCVTLQSLFENAPWPQLKKWRKQLESKIVHLAPKHRDALLSVLCKHWDGKGVTPIPNMDKLAFDDLSRTAKCLMRDHWDNEGVINSLIDLLPHLDEAALIDTTEYFFEGIGFSTLLLEPFLYFDEDWLDGVGERFKALFSRRTLKNLDKTLAKQGSFAAFQECYSFIEKPLPDDLGKGLVAQAIRRTRSIIAILSKREDFWKLLDEKLGPDAIPFVAFLCLAAQPAKVGKEVTNASEADVLEVLATKGTLFIDNEDLWVERAKTLSRDSGQTKWLSPLLDDEEPIINFRAAKVLSSIGTVEATLTLMEFPPANTDESEILEPLWLTIPGEIRVKAELLRTEQLFKANRLSDITFGIGMRWEKVEPCGLLLARELEGRLQSLLFAGSVPWHFYSFLRNNPCEYYLEELGSVWQEDEPPLNLAFAPALSLFSPDDKRLSQVIDVSRFYSFNDKEEDLKTISLRLRCPNCSAAYDYKVSHVIITMPKTLEPFIDRPEDFLIIGNSLICKRCKMRDDFQWTEDASSKMVQQVVRWHVTEEAEPPPYAQIVSATSSVGDSLSKSETERRLHRKHLSQPNDEDVSFRYASLLINFRITRKALAFIDHYLINCKSKGTFRQLRAQCLEHLGHDEEAYAEYERGALEMTKDDVHGSFIAMDLGQRIRDYSKRLKKKINGHVLDHLSQLAADPQEMLTNGPVQMPVRTQKVGRNSPCPCGSGRKYKKCCLKKQGKTATTKPGPPPGALIQEVNKWVFSKVIGGSSPTEIKRAAKHFVAKGENINKLMEQSESPESAMFYGYFAYNWHGEKGDKQSPAERFAELATGRLNKKMKTAVADLVSTQHTGWFEFEEIDRTRGQIEVTDLLTQDKFTIRDYSLASSLSQGDMLIATIANVGGEWGCFGCVQQVNRNLRDRLTARLISMRKELAPESSWTKFLSRHFAQVRQWLIEIGQIPPRLFLSTGEEPSYQYIIYSFSDRAKVLAALEDSDTWNYIGKSKGNEVDGEIYDIEHKPEHATLPFQVPIDENPTDGRLPFVIYPAMKLPEKALLSGEGHQDEKLESIAKAIVGTKQLELVCHSKERMNHCRPKLEESLKGLIKLQKESVPHAIDAEELWAEPQKRSIFSEALSEPPQTLSDHELNLRAYRFMLYSFINEPNPALGNKSPIEASQIPSLRPELEKILRDMESHLRHGSNHEKESKQIILNEIREQLNML